MAWLAEIEPSKSPYEEGKLSYIFSSTYRNALQFMCVSVRVCMCVWFGVCVCM